MSSEDYSISKAFSKGKQLHLAESEQLFSVEVQPLKPTWMCYSYVYFERSDLLFPFPLPNTLENSF